MAVNDRWASNPGRLQVATSTASVGEEGKLTCWAFGVILRE